MEMWDSLLRMVSALALVLGLMGLCVAAARRVLGRGPAEPDAPVVQVLGTGYLGPRRELIVVAVAGEVLLLGATNAGLVSLGRIRDPERVARLVAHRTGGHRAPAGGVWTRRLADWSRARRRPAQAAATASAEARAADGCRRE